MKALKSIHVLAVALAFCLLRTLGQAQVTITVLETFDYPGGAGAVSTTPFGINDHGDIAGVFVDADSKSSGFVRFADGTFSPLIVEPNDAANFTQARGINNSGTICGDYTGSDGHFHAFFKVGDTFTEYDVPGSTDTLAYGLNSAGDFVGTYDMTGHIGGIPFLSVGGTVSPIGIPEDYSGAACGVNDTNAAVGDYLYFRYHGFYQDSTGAVQLSIDPTGSYETTLLGINRQNWIVGSYFDANGQHGLLFVPPQRFVTFDYGARTSLNGINRAGQISGSYFDNRLHRVRGFIAVATRTRTSAADDGQF